MARPQTQRTYALACARFVRWLGPLAGPEELTAASIAAYHAHLVAGGRSSATVRKDRAALNSLLRWLGEHELLPARQAREALAVRLPRARRTTRETPKALSAGHYERLVREAKARIADDPLAGTRDLAIVLVLGDAGLRCEELAALQRRDFLPARRGAKLRALEVRHGKGDRQRRVRLSGAATRAIVRWDRERARALGDPSPGDPLFITLGRRRRDGSYARLGGRCGQEVVSDVLKRLGTAAELPEELRHPHALRHTCATELLRAGATLADVRVFLGHYVGDRRSPRPSGSHNAGSMRAGDRASRVPAITRISHTPRSRRRRSTWTPARTARSTSSSSASVVARRLTTTATRPNRAS